jgi:hypothetical protein
MSDAVPTAQHPKIMLTRWGRCNLSMSILPDDDVPADPKALLV